MNIDGKEISKVVRNEIKKQTEILINDYNCQPGLAVVLVGERKDSQTYVRMKHKAALECGFHNVDVKLDENCTQKDIEEVIDNLNNDDKIHGILVQLPLPKHINESEILEKILVSKDVDGFAAENIGNMALKGGKPPLSVPCTPAGCIELLQKSNVDTKGKHAVVVGRSNIVGMPVSLLLLSMDCTVTICHSKTKNLPELVKQADIVVAAIGRANYVKGEWIKKDAIIIDVGINAVEDLTKKRGYRLVGDVEYDEAKKRASLITPVPGGVGPMTIAMLMKNTLNLARASLNLERIKLRKDNQLTDKNKKEFIHTNEDLSQLQNKLVNKLIFISITCGVFGFVLGGLSSTLYNNNNNKN